MKKRIILLLLCVLTLTVSLCLFTACDEGKTPDNGGGTIDSGIQGGETGGGTVPEKAEISFKTLTVDGTNVYGKVSNSTTTFSFINEISTSGGAKYIVSTNITGTEEIPTKTVELNVGDNTVYVIEKIDGEPTAIYTVVIRRKPIYEVTFDTKGGTLVEPQQIEEGFLATEPTTFRAGYTFASWSYDFTAPITDNTEITANWNANGDTPYKVEYYRQNLDLNGYDLIASETINTSGKTGTTAYAPEKTFDHFAINKSMGKLSGKIDGEGTLVLKVYYTRNTYSIGAAVNNSKGGSVTGGGTYAYGSTVTVTATPNPGYNFIGWYSGETKLSSETTYTFTVDKNAEARFELDSALAIFDYTLTATTCQITGIKDKTVTEICVPDYVTSIKSGAFSGCSKLEKITIAFVGGSRKTSSDTYQYPFGYIFGTSSYTGGTATEQYYYGSSTSSTTYDYYYIPSTLKSVTVTGGEILYGAFYSCSSLA